MTDTRRVPQSERDYRHLVSGGEAEDLIIRINMPPADSAISGNLLSMADRRGGILIVGAEKNGEPVGLQRAEAERIQDRLKRLLRSLFRQPAEIQILKLIGGHVVISSIPQLSVGGSTPGLLGEEDPPDDTRAQLQVFVAMSFHHEEEPALVDYFEAIKRAGSRTGLPFSVLRVDNVLGDYDIGRELIESIDRSDIVLADLTLGSRNVYFELGYARGRQKRVIQTARRGSGLEFDVRQWRTIFYRNAKELEDQLLNELLDAYRVLAPKGR
jgi:nucleoside 2-deoxyribosyltransferase